MSEVDISPYVHMIMNFTWSKLKNAKFFPIILLRWLIDAGAECGYLYLHIYSFGLYLHVYLFFCICICIFIRIFCICHCISMTIHVVLPSWLIDTREEWGLPTYRRSGQTSHSNPRAEVAWYSYKIKQKSYNIPIDIPRIFLRSGQLAKQAIQIQGRRLRDILWIFL